ncbi:MAG: valine--tRNA ligase [Roseiflexaceae bacterium]
MGFPQRYDAAEAERRWQDIWASARLYEFDPADPRPPFAIDTPPPTVSGAIHIGHVYSYVQAEAMARFWRMQGRNVYYPFGFDDNGLPTERFVEKLRGIRARDLSRPEFIATCLEVSHEFEDRFETFWRGLGMSVDWRLRYSTIDPAARRISQWSFLDLYRKGLVYRAQSPNPWCIECQTAIAQAEMEDAERGTTFYTLAFGLADERRKTKDESNTIANDPSSFVLRPSSALPIATTRPELLPACVAVFVHPEDTRFTQLIGQAAIVPLVGRAVPILADPAVDPNKGSGAVMCCTFGDTTDVAWWRAHNLPLIPLISRQGRLSADGGPYAGLSLAEARKRIVADLRDASLLLNEQPAEQTVRVHERCKTPLEILETQQWFVRVLDAKEALLAAGRQIAWRPAYMRARYEHWVENLAWDWCISRQRFYGVPFPVWHCDECGAIILADETQLPIDPSADAPPRACACGNTKLRPDPDVMDTWATSSMTPQIAARMFENPELYRRLFPMQMRPQAHDNIRVWAFYTIVKSHYHFGTIPWETLMISGHGLDRSGHKISKSRANASSDPAALIARYGADPVRYWACGGALGADRPINEDEMRQGARLVTKLWNASRFIASHLELADDEGGRTKDESQSDSPLSFVLPPLSLLPADRALLSWLQRLIERATASFQSYEYAAACEATERFFWGTLCDNYLEWVKGRLYDGTELERSAAQATLYHTLLTILKLFAPILPHITEEIYQQLYCELSAVDTRAATGFRSIHISAWPQADPALLDEPAEQIGAALLAITSSARRFKSARKLGLGAELAGLAIVVQNEGMRQALDQSRADIRSVTRAREITFAAQPDERFEELEPGLWIVIDA